jgi:hypothetical protein
MTKDEALDLALEALTPFSTPNWAGTGVDKANEAITAIKQARSAPVQVFDHVNAARQGLRDAQNRSRQISNLINCGTCGYPLAPEERTSLIERDGVMVKPAPVQEPVCIYPRCSCNSKDFCDPKRQQALDKKAENARELGLDYEPVAPVREDWGPGPHECHSLTAAPMQEPVAWRYRGILHDFDPSDWAEGPVTPLYTTPPVQEPVAWTVSGKITDWSKDFSAYQTKHYTRPVYTPPAAQRQWVGLTDAEVMQTMSGDWTSQFYFARAIEAKLKEKNT